MKQSTDFLYLDVIQLTLWTRRIDLEHHSYMVDKNVPNRKFELTSIYDDASIARTKVTRTVLLILHENEIIIRVVEVLVQTLHLRNLINFR